MAQDQKQTTINFSVDPNKTPVLYADGYVIANSEHVVVFNFAQAAPGDATQQTIVARVALTRAQAKEFLKNLNDHMEKFEV